MGNSALKNRVIGIVVVKMHRVVIGGDFGKHLNVSIGHNLAQMPGHADFDIFNTNCATGHVVEHLAPQGNNRNVVMSPE
jgi:hypothetical protein